jgi:anti-sigma B factor antagonist
MSGPEVAPFHEHVKKLGDTGLKKIVVDFSRVKWFGSSMLGVLTASLSTVRTDGGDVRLAGVVDKIESILMVTQLASIFRTFRTVDEAVGSFEE